MTWRGFTATKKRSPTRTLGRRDGGISLVAALERIGNEAGRLHVFDERAHITRRRGAALGQAHRLLDHHEAAIHHAHGGVGLGVLDQHRLYARDYVELVLEKELDHRLAATGMRTHDLRVLDSAREKQVVSRA